jgi:APA family basic amino acid/polyamine antiporter
MNLTAANNNKKEDASMGFWRCWAMAVGVMIGSGIFLLPTVLAPFGSISLVGWLVTSLGAIGIALVLGRLANRTDNSVGGPYAYTRDAFGDLTGFLIAWGYWVSVTLAITAVAIALAGYVGALIPSLSSKLAQNFVALSCIWLLTAINIKGVSEAASVQLVLTLLKIIPLVVIIALGFYAGSLDTLPEFNPSGQSMTSAVTATALLTMWAFIGVEAAVIPAGDVVDPKRTIPRAVTWAAITVAGLYILVTMAVMMLVPAGVLATSEAPFVDAAKLLGPWGALFIGVGAIVATAGSLNGDILVAGQMPMAAALDGLAPKRFAKTNKGHAPQFSLVISSLIGSLLLVLNVSDDLVSVFTFLISISTLCVLAPYGVSALAELKHSWKSARGWALSACLSAIYTIIAASGSGLVVLLWGAALMIAGLPLYMIFKRNKV